MTKTTHIQIRVSEADKAAIENAAKDARRSVSEYVLRETMAQVWHEATSPPDDVPAGPLPFGHVPREVSPEHQAQHDAALAEIAKTKLPPVIREEDLPVTLPPGEHMLAFRAPSPRKEFKPDFKQ